MTDPNGYALVLRKRDEFLTVKADWDILAEADMTGDDAREINELRRLAASLKEPEQFFFTC